MVEVRVRESARARTTRIIVGPRRPLEIIVPAGTSDDKVDEALADRSRWIARKLEAVRAIVERPPTLGLNGKVWLLGEAVKGPAESGRLERWYRQQARRLVGEVV